jgi:hypothetical protein
MPRLFATLSVRRAATLVLAATALAFTLSSCSSMRFAYGFADNYFVGAVQDYFDPSPQQLRSVRANAEGVLAWHREQELPLYVAMFDEAARKIADGLSEDEVRWGIAQARTRYASLAQRIVNVNAPLLAKLSEENFTALEQKFAQDNTEIERRYVSGNAARRDETRVERVQRQLERWVGTLDAKQRQIVAAWVASAPNAYADWQRQRTNRQQALLDALRGERDPAALAARVTELWVQRGASAEAREQQEARIGALILAIDASLSAAQRERVVERMRGYAGEFRALGQ